MGKYMVAAGLVCLLLCRGMDVYIKHFSKDFHDEFYTCGDIVDAYSRYIAKIVKRYAHEPAVLGIPLSIICCGRRTHFTSRLGTRQRPTLFLRPSCVGGLQPSDDYSMGGDRLSSREGECPKPPGFCWLVFS